MPNIETRFLPAASGTPAADERLVKGMIPYNVLSQPMSMPNGRTFREVIRPGAFDESLRRRDDVLARYEHDKLLGRVSSGTLRLSTDAAALRYEADVAPTTNGDDLLTLLRRGDIRGSSFAFTVPKDGDNWKQEPGGLIRELRTVNLIDVSPVAKPAYPQTSAALASYRNAAIKMRLDLAERQ